MREKWATLAAGLMVSVGLSHTASAEPPAWDLAAAIRDAGFVATWTEHGDAVITFESTDVMREIEEWPVTVRLIRNGEWVLVYATVLDGEPDPLFPPHVLAEALTFNADHAGCKFVLDAERGDLDLQVEIPQEGFSVSLLREMIQDVASTSDAEWPRFRDLLRDGPTSSE